MISVLNIIGNELNGLGIPYEYMEWTDGVQYPYWVGEYSEVTTDAEDGGKEYTFMLTGTTKGTWLELEEARTKIETHFPVAGGFKTSTETDGVVIFYENAIPVPTGEADLKRIQVNLRIKYWKGMNN